MFAFLGLPPPPAPSNWTNHQAEIADVMDDISECNMRQAIDELKTLKQSLGEIDEDGNVDVAVSLDGSWNQVGHSGSFCVVYAVSVDTGKVIDFEMKYRLCKTCEKYKSREGTPEYEAWKLHHAPNCTKTHDGSSSSIESACIVDIFRRSEEKNGLRYTTFVGDGDSSSYKIVCKMNLYGGVPIKKENCIGHIQKPMGCRLRKLLQESKGQKLEDGKCLSGRGCLTQKVVDSFQVFYGIALRSNSGNIESTKTATMTILNHYALTPEHPNHVLCPVGGNSWCKYQVDQATGTSTYRYPKYPLTDAVLQKVLPVFKDLSAESLLITCQRGLTQNPNEALHSMLWKLVPKKQYFGEPDYRIASALVCGHWNSGQLKFNKSVCEAFGYDVCYYSESMWSKVDK